MQCKKEKEAKTDKTLNDKEFSFLFQEKALQVENEIAYEGNLPCGHCKMVSTYLYFDLRRFHYKRKQKYYSDDNNYTMAIDSGALSFIQGNKVDPHSLIYGLEADSTNIQYFLIVNENEIELLDPQLNSLNIIPAPILHKQVIRQISNK